MFNLIISTVLQVILAIVIPFIYYYVKTKKTKNFKQFIGLKRINYKIFFIALSIGILLLIIPIVFTILSNDFKGFFTSKKLLSGNLLNDNNVFLEIVFIFIISYLKTGLSEEIFFRGFLAKLLNRKTSFKKANFYQSLIFGLIHLSFAIPFNNIPFYIFSFSFPFIFAYIGFYINEKMAEGSILPSIIIHGTLNFIFYSIVAFVFT